MYPGRVAAVNMDGTLQVCYDDGDLRDGILLANVCFDSRPSSFPDLPLTCKLEVGNQVEYSLEPAVWIPAKVVEILPPGMVAGNTASLGETYTLSLCNGRLATNVLRNQIRCYIPNVSLHLRPMDQIELLLVDGVKTWVLAKVDETGMLAVVNNGGGGGSDDRVAATYELAGELEMRFPIPYVAPPPTQDEEDFLDATPMLLSMQERMCQSIEVGAQVLITDKNGGALPKTGKADSAQVSIINFPLPADGIIESITLRLFEAPAEDSSQLEVILFDRENALPAASQSLSPSRASSSTGASRTDSSAESSPQLAPAVFASSTTTTAAAAVPAVTTPPRFFVSPDLPYRVSRSYIQVDPQSRAVQCCKLATPLRGSAGQYLGLMNRKGRLNLAYTPDKKKPGESWSEKSVEVFYLMPRMVPKSFVGGPYATREWHGRAGWYATLLVSDPVEAVDPAFQRRCEVHALSKANGTAELDKFCWLLTSLLKMRGTEFANQLLYETPALLRALRILCQVSDSVVELVYKLCVVATVLQPRAPVALLRLQSALRFKATEMQIVQQGRQNLGGATSSSFQGLLRCLLAIKRLTIEQDVAEATAFVATTPVSTANVIKRIKLPPQPATESVPLIRYELKLNGALVVASTSTNLLPLDETNSTGAAYELVINDAEEGETGDHDFETMLKTSGPILSNTELYFPASHERARGMWNRWTSPVELTFRRVDQASKGAMAKGRRPTTKRIAGDWLDDLECCTTLLQAFGKQEEVWRKEPPSSTTTASAAARLPPKEFVREQYLQWRKQRDRQVLTLDGSEETRVCIPGAARLRLEWIRAPQLAEMHSLSMSNASGFALAGRNGLPPALELVEGDVLVVKISPNRLEYDPESILHQSLEAERADFPLAQGICNCLGEPAKIRVSGGELQITCSRCGVGGCKEELIANLEGRIVSLHRSRFSCSVCEQQPMPCSACLLFPESLAVRKSIRVRPRSSFDSVDKYVHFIKRALIPGVPVRIVSPGADANVVHKFARFDAQANACLLRGSSSNAGVALSDLELVECAEALQQTRAASDSIASVAAETTLASPPATVATAAAAAPLVPGTFCASDLGPDMEVSDDGLTCTRLRSVGWGTQRLSTYLELGSVTTVQFRIVRNSSNHLFFGVVSPAFALDWSRRMMEANAWSIRRDGSLHANGREQRTGDAPSSPLESPRPGGNGEELTMLVDLTSSLAEERFVVFSQGEQVLGRITGLPSRVVPAVSFGGSNQIIAISSYVSSPPSAAAASAAPVAATAPATAPTTSKQNFDFGVLQILPEYDEVSDLEEQEYLATACLTWTIKQDRLLVCHVDQLCNEHRVSFQQILLLPQDQRDFFFGARSKTRFLDLLLEEQPLLAVQQRFEWIVSFNRSLSQALPLLDLNFEHCGGSGSGGGDATREEGDASTCAVARYLGACSYLILDALKRPLWEEALESTRTEEGQFEVVLDFGRALAHREYVDVHGRFTVFAQAFRAMNSLPPSRLRGKGQLYRATLRGMRAHDDGGPYRQSLATYCEELMSVPGTGLFLPCANRTNEIAVNRDRWLPNPGACSAVQFQMFEFVGKLMGIALRNREFLNLRLPSLVWKWLVNRRPTFEDVRAVDLLFANRVQELLLEQKGEGKEEAGIGSGEGEDVESMMNFTCYSLDGRVIELVSKGEERVLQNTVEDRREWARLATEYKLNEFNAQLEAIRRGLHSVVPQRMLVLFQTEELELMVCGRPQIDLALLREMTVYAGCGVQDAHVTYFWNVLASFTHELRSLYLKFVFGRSTLPSREAWGAPHKISSFETRNPSDADSLLPRSHTCYFTLDLPRYSSEEVLRKKLLFAIENCTEIDADQTTTGNRSAALGFDLNLDLDELAEVAANATAQQQQQQIQQVQQQPSISPAIALVNSFGSFSSRMSERCPSSSSLDSEEEEGEFDDFDQVDAFSTTTDQEFQIHHQHASMDANLHFGPPIDFEL